MRILSCLLAFMLSATVAHAQALPIDHLTPPFTAEHDRHIADLVSNMTVGTAIALDTLASWRSANRSRAFLMEGARYGTVLGVATLTKLIVHRTRPDASDQLSFFSQHTALAGASYGGQSLGLSLPLTVGTGGLRIAADKHYLTDTLVGAAVGMLAGKYLR